MKEQRVVIIKGLVDCEEKINEVIKEYNEQNWFVKHITSHASNVSVWTILFEREVKENAD